jgi:hypothetical protein
MWPSIVYQPTQLAKSLLGAKAWRRPEPLRDDERVDYSEAAAPLEPAPGPLGSELEEGAEGARQDGAA